MSRLLLPALLIFVPFPPAAAQVRAPAIAASALPAAPAVVATLASPLPAGASLSAPAAPLPAAPPAANGDPLSLGTMRTWDRGSSFFIAAPHGWFDGGTEVIVENFLNATGWNGIIAEGYRTEEHPINVNRPTEGVRLPPELEKHTPEAKIVYDAFRRKLAGAAGPPPTFYVEIHGNARPESEGNIEVAVAGIPTAQRQGLKDILNRELRAAGISDIGVLVEGVDDVHFAAEASKRWGTFHDLVPGLQFEIPHRARTEQIDELTGFFKAALSKAAEIAALAPGSAELRPARPLLPVKSSSARQVP